MTSEGGESSKKRVIFRGKKRASLPEVDLVNIDDEIKIKTLSELIVGDHVIIAHRDELCRFTHAILVEFSVDLKLIQVVYYADGNEFIKRFVIRQSALLNYY